MTFKEFAQSQIDRHYYLTPSAIVLISYYHGFTGKFTELRAQAQQIIAIFKQQ